MKVGDTHVPNTHPTLSFSRALAVQESGELSLSHRACQTWAPEASLPHPAHRELGVSPPHRTSSGSSALRPPFPSTGGEG